MPPSLEDSINSLPAQHMQSRLGSLTVSQMGCPVDNKQRGDVVEHAQEADQVPSSSDLTGKVRGNWPQQRVEGEEMLNASRHHDVLTLYSRCVLLFTQNSGY